jgi:hypothetical protein
MDLKGLAEHLGVNYWRARRWRRNAIAGQGDIQLLAPDVLAAPPRWSPEASERWARDHGLWPPGVDQYECSECGRPGSVYSSDDMKMRDHGWTADPDDETKMVACPGSGLAAKGRALATA